MICGPQPKPWLPFPACVPRLRQSGWKRKRIGFRTRGMGRSELSSGQEPADYSEASLIRRIAI